MDEDRITIKALINNLRDKNSDFCWRCEIALKDFTGLNFGDDYDKWMKWFESDFDEWIKQWREKRRSQKDNGSASH